MSSRSAVFFSFKSQEQKQIILMLAMGFFMGAFIATYQVTADSLFLNRLGSQLNRAFLIAGGLGIITTGIFSFFQNWIRFTTLAKASFVLILAFTVTAYLLLEFGNPDQQNTFIFALYCMSGPITAVILLTYWGVFGRLFNFRQSKRIIGWIDTGQLIAAIISTLIIIPFTSELVGDTSRYLVFCSVSILIVLILLYVISSTFSIAKNNPREFGSEVREETRILNLIKDPYILLMCVFLLISMTTLMLTQFSFQKLVQEQYPDQSELTRFNSFFIGAVYGLSLIMQTFINHRVISNYGLRISLFILPVVVGIFAAASALIGTFFGFNKLLSPAGFIYFFLFVALTRLFNWTLRDSLENPVFKLLFIPLDSKLRFNIQAKVEGLINESSRFVAGAIIFSFAFFTSFEIIHVSFLLIPLIIAYCFVVHKLYNGYRSKIRRKLEVSGDSEQERLEKGMNIVTRKLEGFLQVASGGKAVFSFKLLEKINAGNLPAWINGLISNKEETARHYAQEKLNELKGLSVSDRYVIKADSSSAAGKNMLSLMDLHSILDNGGDITKGRIQKLARSFNADDRHYAAELLLHTGKDECNVFLTELLMDLEPKVRNTAIKTAIKKPTPEVINLLIENLGNSVYSNQAMNSLVLIGPETLTALESAFYRSGQNTQVMLKIIQVLGRIGGQRVKELLWNKIDYPNKVIVSQVLLSLGEAGFKAGPSQMTRIRYAIEADIADIRWNLSAIQEISEEAFSSRIKEALRWEIQNDIEHVYMLLAMLYDTRSIQLVKENIESGTTDGITYAVELLDVFLADQLKQRVIPILDDLTETERITRLEDIYPRVRLDGKLVLKFIINRDFTQSNRWTKACVIRQIGLLQLADFKLDLIAQLFNPDTLIREISAKALYEINHDEYTRNVRRLPENVRRELDEVILHQRRLARFDKIMFFLTLPIFEGIPGLALSYLADISEEYRMKQGETLILDERSNNFFYLMIWGNVRFYQKGEVVATFTEGQFVGEMLSMPNFVNTNLLTAESDSVIIRFNKDQFYELLSDNVKLADKMIEYI